MTELFRNKYRVPSARARLWHYGDNAAYFITICTAARLHYFGKIKNHKMIFSDLGKYAASCWFDIPKHCPNVELGAFIVMPNHVHGIVVLNKPDSYIPDLLTVNATFPTANMNDAGDDNDLDDDLQETLHATSLQQQTEFMSKISPKSGELSTVMRSYKSAVSRVAYLNDCPFGWQTRFHDRIIRDDAEYLRIEQYIETNPENWAKDKFNRV